jgi:hypothetical protein
VDADLPNPAQPAWRVIRGTSAAAASALARSVSSSWITEVMVIVGWPSISLMSCRSEPEA